MRSVAVIIFVMAAFGLQEAAAQSMDNALPQRAEQKASCQKEARMIYRNGRTITIEWRERVSQARRAYVQECMTKAGFAS